MKSLRMVTAVLLICSIGLGSFASDLSDKLPAKVKIIAKLDLAKLRNSQFFSKIETRHAERIQLFRDRLGMAAGVDPESVKTVWLAGIKKGEGMLVLQGDFDSNRISDAVSGKAEVELVERAGCDLAMFCPDQRKGGKNLVVILDEHTMAVGKRDCVDAFIASYQGKGESLAPTEAEKVRNALGKDAVFQGVLIQMPAGAAEKKPMLAGIEGAQVLINVAEDLIFDLNIKLVNEEQAIAMQQIVTGIVALHQLNKAGDEKCQLARENALANLDIKQEGSKVNVVTKIDADILNQMIEMEKN